MTRIRVLSLEKLSYYLKKINNHIIDKAGNVM